MSQLILHTLVAVSGSAILGIVLKASVAMLLALSLGPALRAARAAVRHAIYAALFGWSAPTDFVSFVRDVLTTVNGWLLIIAGAIVGAIFGWIVLALSVVSLPMLVDCDVSAPEAVSASWRAAHANKAEMIRWGLTVLVVLVLASLPLFVGLAFALPWLGYSTWHLYTRLVDRDSLPARRRRAD